MNKGLTVTAKATWENEGVWTLEVVCPICGEKHFHGGGNGAEPDLGYRVAHCFTLFGYPGDGYTIGGVQ
jgi:hypothetical protein